MGVYVKGMEMPKDKPLIIKINPDGAVSSTFDNDYRKYEAVSISPHGRLGDLDKLEKMFADIDSAPYSCFDGAEPFYSAEDAANIIRLAPTVIDAEEAIA